MYLDSFDKEEKNQISIKVQIIGKDSVLWSIYKRRTICSDRVRS